MKKYFIILAAAAMAVCSCAKNSVAVDPDEIFDGTEKYAITFGSNLRNISTKSIGSVDAWQNGMDLYVYGVERNENVLDLQNGILINNVKATVNAGAIEVFDPQHTSGNIPFYYDYTKKYDFFGYYVDDAADPSTATPTSLQVHINGTQDILLASASRTEAVSGTTIDPNKLFSAYSVRKGITPNLKFQHMLSRLKFVVINGNGAAAEQLPELRIDTLCVTSPAYATLCPVGDQSLTVNSNSVPEKFYLMNGTQEIAPYLVIGSGQIGESIMVMPGQEEYELMFRLVQAGNPVKVEQTEIIKIPGGAVAGKSYTVNLTVYNLQTVAITIELTPWDSATDPIDIGADED